MTDRIKGFTVVLETPIRKDDVEGIAKAIEKIRGVADVVPHVMTFDDYMVYSMVLTKLEPLIYENINELFKDIKNGGL